MTLVETARLIDLNVLSIIILSFILAAVVNNRLERSQLSSRLFMLLVALNMLMCGLDIASWIWNGQSGQQAMVGNIAGNTLLFIFSPLPVAVWYVYAHFQTHHDAGQLRKIFIRLTPVLIANAILTLISLRTGWFFVITAANQYQRGVLYPVHVLIVFGLLGASVLMIAQRRKHLEPREFRTLILYPLPPVLGVTLQIFLFGLSLNWASMMVSALIVYLQLQAHGMNTDFLTGTYNRRHFETLINHYISRQPSGTGFAVILADLDNFKKINDLYGHDQGDEALQTAVRLMRRCLRREDLIARFGGDEFYMLLHLSDETALRGAVERIYRAFDLYNQNSNAPYQLGLSMGAAIYDKSQEQNAEQFLRSVDQLMYQEKISRQQDDQAGSAGLPHV